MSVSVGDTFKPGDKVTKSNSQAFMMFCTIQLITKNTKSLASSESHFRHAGRATTVLGSVWQ